MVPHPMEGAWKYAKLGCGVLCVNTCGTGLTPWWPVSSLDSTQPVRLICREAMHLERLYPLPLVLGAYTGRHLDGSGPIHLSGVLCSGDEDNITQCPTNPSSSAVLHDSCLHIHDVDIYCSNLTEPGSYIRWLVLL